MENIRVIIADDINLLCEGIKAILSKDENIEVVATAMNGLDAFKKAEVFNPDIVLMDMRMPEYDGVYGTKMIKAAFPEIKVLILTTFDDSKSINSAIMAGADGYLLKESKPEDIITAIKNMNQNKNVFDSKVFANIRKSMFGGKSELASDIILTDREKDIIACVVDGMSNREIAQKLYISEGTVRNSISFLLETLNVNDRTQLAVFAVKHNITD